MLALVFLHAVLNGVGGLVIAAFDLPDREFHQHDRQADGRHEAEERTEDQQQSRVALGHPGSVFPVGIDDAVRRHDALAELPDHRDQAGERKPAGILHDHAFAHGEFLRHELLGEARDGVGQDDLIAVDGQLRHGVQRGVAHVDHGLGGRLDARGVGRRLGSGVKRGGRGKIVFAFDHARDGEGLAVDRHFHPGHIAAAEEVEGCLRVEHDAVGHIILIRHVAAGQQLQRMEQEIVSSHADGRDRHAARRLAGDGQLGAAAVGVGVEARIGFRREDGVLDECVLQRRAERADRIKVDGAVHRQEGRDLREALIAAAAPDVGGGLGDERAGHLPQHGEAEHRQRRLDQAGNEEGKLPSVQPRQPAMPLKPPAPDHPLSASRTCLPASTGLLLVVMMKSPALIPETAADLSSRASSCTVTRVAM